MNVLKYFDWPRKYIFYSPMATANQGNIAVTEYAAQTINPASVAEVKICDVEVYTSGRPVDINFYPMEIASTGRVNIYQANSSSKVSYLTVIVKRNGNIIYNGSPGINGFDFGIGGNQRFLLNLFSCRDFFAAAGLNRYSVYLLSDPSFTFVVEQGRCTAMEL